MKLKPSHDIYMVAFILLVFVGFITLGGLGVAAVNEPFYWVAFVFNLAIYALILRNLWKAAKEQKAAEIEAEKEAKETVNKVAQSFKIKKKEGK